jgi:hypothetical protein
VSPGSTTYLPPSIRRIHPTDAELGELLFAVRRYRGAIVLVLAWHHEVERRRQAGGEGPVQEAPLKQ